ncbi:hypothetical protein Tco_0716814 [Tanacetum coccineum]
MKACNGGDKIYGSDEHGALKQCGGNELDDSIRARRYNEWCTKNNKHQDYENTSTPNIESDTLAPGRILNPSNQEDLILKTKSYFPNSLLVTQNKLQPRNYSFKEWLKVKIRHTDVDKSMNSKVLKEWILYNFDVEADFTGICNDPYSRSLDEYKAVFNNEIKQLAIEYELSIGKKGYFLDDIWEKCEKVHGGTWHDGEFKEEERWENGLDKKYYDPPQVCIEIFEVKRYSFKQGKFFVYATKQLEDGLPLGRVNGSRFKGMMRKEMDTGGSI